MLREGTILLANCLLVDGDVTLAKNEPNMNASSIKLLKYGDYIIQGFGLAMVFSLH